MVSNSSAGSFRPRASLKSARETVPLDPPDARGHRLQGLFLFLELLGDFAAELLQQVFHRDQTHQGAVFIHHQGQTLVLGLEFVQQVKGPLVFRDIIGRAQEMPGHLAPSQGA